MENFYTVLGVVKDASDKDLRQAYRKQARQYHPDLNPDDRDAEEMFKKINEAYEVLSDPENRKSYDKYGENWKHAEQLDRAYTGRQAAHSRRYSYDDGGSAFDFSRIPNGGLFADLFSGMEEVRPSTARHPVQLSLEEAFYGAVRFVELSSSGRDAKPRKLEVKIPPGVDTGSRVRISAEDGRNSQIYLEVTVRSHSRFRRTGHDLHEEFEVSLADAVLGNEVAVPTLTGQVMLTIPPETQNAQIFRLSSQGMPQLNRLETRGDLLATVKVVLPQDLIEEEKKLFQQLKDLRCARRNPA